MSESNEKLPTKPRAGKFLKGQSGNPKGRPKGKRSLITQMREAMGDRLAKDALEILEKVIAQAKAGNETSQKMLLDRLWPTEKADPKAAGKRQMPSISIRVEQAAPPAARVIEHDR